MKGTYIMLIVSDLFFNHSNENYNKLYVNSGSNPTQEEIRDALKLDGAAFLEHFAPVASLYNIDNDDELNPDALADDFLNRV